MKLWQPLDKGNQQSDYNRYAHVNFVFDRNPLESVPTSLKLVGGDNFHIITEPCSAFLENSHVDFLVAVAPLSGQDSCAQLVKQISYPEITFYIYRVNGLEI